MRLRNMRVLLRRLVVRLVERACKFRQELLRELEREPDHWFRALHELTGVNPVPESAQGRVPDMAHAWIDWGRQKGFRW